MHTLAGLNTNRYEGCEVGSLNSGFVSSSLYGTQNSRGGCPPPNGKRDGPAEDTGHWEVMDHRKR